MTHHVLSVTIGDHLFGLDIHDIKDVLRRQEATAIPLAGHKIAGLMNLRGTIVTLLHGYACLDLQQDDHATMSIVIEHHKELYGILFDTVGNILELENDVLQPVPPTLDPQWKSLSNGVFRLPEGLMVFLDSHKLIASVLPAQEAA